MASTKVAPATHSQPSRKGKKAWRKNIDVSEVQTGLEEAREEVIQGGIIAEKPSEELFMLDTTGSDDIKKKHIKHDKPLKADEIIAARASAVPAIDSRKRKSTEIVTSEKDKRTRKNTYVPHSEVRRLKALAAWTQKDEDKSSPAEHDPWAVVPKVQDPQFSFLEEKQPIREPETLKHKPISLAASGKPFAAVRRPDAGKSYNPSFEEWQENVTRTGNKEVEAERKRIQEAKEDAERTAKALAEAAKPDSVSDEEYESAWESEWEGIKSGGEENEWLGKKRPERKTPAERNKIKRRKVAEQKARHETRSKQSELRQDHARERKNDDGSGRSKRLALRAEDSSEESGEEEVLRRRPLGKNTWVVRALKA